MKAGLTISGINAEVMPGQWEFQIGPTGPLDTGDQVLVARWLLHRLGEDFGITASLAVCAARAACDGAATSQTVCA
jgi:glutamine synthetase